MRPDGTEDKNYQMLAVFASWSCALESCGEYKGNPQIVTLFMGQF